MIGWLSEGLRFPVMCIGFGLAIAAALLHLLFARDDEQA